MTENDSSTPDGVRERRKSATRDALTQAAVELVASEGLDALTADRIADAAGVSRRTLFNYFPRVEDVLTATIEDVTRDTIEAVLARPAGESLRDSVLAVLEDLLAGPAFTQARALERAADRSPATRRFLLEFGDRQATAFEEALRCRIGPDADPVYVAALAGAACAMLGRVTRLVTEPGTGPGADLDEAEVARRHQEWIRRAFEHLFAGFDESAACLTTPARTQEI